MILSAEQIRHLLEHPPANPADRLVLSPLLDLKKQLKPGTSSVDVRLGQRFHVPLRAKLSQLDVLSETHQADLLKYKDDTFVPIGDYFVLHPGQFVLGETLEWVHLPKDLVAFVIGKSTWGRDGLIIATAIGVHPNFSGILTLEISNVGEIPIYLYPGLAIAQLFLASVQLSDEAVSPVPSAFQIQTTPRTRNVEIEDRDVIDVFKKQLKVSVPDQITLSPVNAPQWKDAAAIQQQAAPLVRAGFNDLGTYSVDKMPGVLLRILFQPQTYVAAHITEHPKAGDWIELATRYNDGSSDFLTTLPDHGVTSPPFVRTVRANKSTPTDSLYQQHLRQRKSSGIKPVNQNDVAREFEDAYMRSMAWKNKQGV